MYLLLYPVSIKLIVLYVKKYFEKLQETLDKGGINLLIMGNLKDGVGIEEYFGKKEIF